MTILTVSQNLKNTEVSLDCSAMIMCLNLLPHSVTALNIKKLFSLAVMLTGNQVAFGPCRIFLRAGKIIHQFSGQVKLLVQSTLGCILRRECTLANLFASVYSYFCRAQSVGIGQ